MSPFFDAGILDSSSEFVVADMVDIYCETFDGVLL